MRTHLEVVDLGVLFLLGDDGHRSTGQHRRGGVTSRRDLRMILTPFDLPKFMMIVKNVDRAHLGVSGLD